jgi:hypothetical protein
MSTILDPTNERQPIRRKLASRQDKIVGRLALLDISKPRGSILIDELESLLAKEIPNLTINRYAKPTFAKPAPDALREKILSENDFVVEALAD